MSIYKLTARNSQHALTLTQRRSRSRPPNQRHLCGHHCHKLNVCIERQPCHVAHSATHILGVHQRLGALHLGGHVGLGVADVDLATRDIVGAAIQRSRFCEPCDAVLGGCIRRRERARAVRRNRSIVDDAASARQVRGCGQARSGIMRAQARFWRLTRAASVPSSGGRPRACIGTHPSNSCLPRGATPTPAARPSAPPARPLQRC